MTYLFDIGNVLLSFDFQPALKALAGPSPDPQAIQKILEAKDDFESGKIPANEYIQWATQLLDSSASQEEFMTAWNSIFTPIPGTWDLAAELKEQGHRLILYSNINPIHAPYCLETYSVFEHFDHAVFSHEIGAIKPHDDFFLRSFDKFNIIPEETIYIDDMPANIAAGKKHGLHSFLYDHRDHRAVLDWLRNF
ncbi:alpha-D-glucose 1-phosphate phosphatase YihX [Rubritalea halochordaticola]|uniref:Alpha-D-glucose 1-phosphate phosphatase YihX n=1 Tax=Rubritalea halochordaticola TaxID=714537 RepID=A0ABP9V0U3_9BACT